MERKRCPVCEEWFYNHKDGSYRCGCEPDSNDPQGEEYERVKREVMVMSLRSKRDDEQ
jgi:hypothetical protein